MKITPKTHVRYVSPYGSPAILPRGEAERLMAEDDERWLRDQAAGLLTERQHQIGPPRIEVLPS